MPKHMTQVPILINQDKDGGHTKNPQSMIENECPTTWWRTSFDALFPRSLHEPIKQDMLWYDVNPYIPKKRQETINFDGDPDTFPRKGPFGFRTSRD